MQSYSSQYELSKAKSTVNDIADAAESVYMQGVGAKTKLFLTIPANIQNATIENRLIKLSFASDGNTRDVYRATDFDIQGNLTVTEGAYWVYLTSKDDYVEVLLNYSDPIIVTTFCGNNLQEFGEFCDGTDVNDETCYTLGFVGGGFLICSLDCNYYNTLGCSNTTIDTTPPSSITNLQNISNSYDWIYWNWTNPTDADFNQVLIYLDGINIANTSDNFYNATGLMQNTSYTITIHTKDFAENINTTNVSNTASTGYAPDMIPPNSVTNLMNISSTTTSIYWTWTNPLDIDFSEAIIYVDGINIANTSNNFYNATGFIMNSSHTITIHTKDLTGNINNTNVSNTASTKYVDMIPPNSVTNLINQSAGTTWIYWTWTNPTDADFSQAIIYLDGVNIANTSNNFYNTTGLITNTSYTLTIHTKDLSGNINTTNVSRLGRTTYMLPATYSVLRWATVAGTGTTNILGAPNNVYDSIGVSAPLYGTTFDVTGLSGTINSVVLIWSHQVPGALSNDVVTLSYGLTTYSDNLIKTYNSANTPVDKMGTTAPEWEYYNATLARTWTWADFANLKIGGAYTKNGGRDSYWYLDAVGVNITYTT